jgi:hypothetical protein
MKITIETPPSGPRVTLDLNREEYENLKAVLKAVNTTRLTPGQATMHDQLARNLNRITFGK